MNQLLAILLMSALTMVLRIGPFVLFGRAEETTEGVRRFGQKLPAALMAMLVVYCLRQTPLTMEGFVPAVVASLVVLFLQTRFHKTVITIILGTATYMILLQMF